MTRESSIPNTLEIIKEGIARLENWVENHEYKGYDPFDGLSSFLRPLTFHNVFLERVLQQSIRQFPFNLRPILGVPPQESPIGRGYMAWGYLTMFRATTEKKYLRKAEACLDWLAINKSSGYKESTWGNNFDYASRSGSMQRYEPTIVWSSLIGRAFMEAYELTGERKYIEIAISICEWILRLPRERTARGACLSYVAENQLSIHNSNMLGAAMLARTGKYSGNNEYFRVAREAVEYSCARQRENGAWYYGEEPKYHWIDNFHTGYNLDSLKCYIDHTGDKNFEGNLHRGYDFFINNFFEGDGRPKYYFNRMYPIDIQCASQAIDTLINFSSYNPSGFEKALRVSAWVIKNMQDPAGYFYYRILPWKKVKIPMVHWGDATIYKALSHLLAKIPT